MFNLTSEVCKKYMEMCIELAKKAPYGVNKPYVGAVVVNDNLQVLGTGYRRFIPGSKLLIHAERDALDNAGRNARGQTLIASLSPCAPTGKNILKPCSMLIIERGIKRIIIGHMDYYLPDGPFPTINFLKKRGVEVIEYPDLASVIEKELFPQH